MSDNEWLEPNDQMGLWENQGRPLTLRSLLVALAELLPNLVVPMQDLLFASEEAADLPLEVEWYNGTTSRALTPMHLDVSAESGRAEALVLTLS